jgi:predicted nucleic-acid-binding Zn-ribbon protein
MSLFNSEAISVTIQGRELKCLVCGHDEFHKREAQLNTAAASFFGFDWANQSGTCYVCAQCAYIHWFLPK